MNLNYSNSLLINFIIASIILFLIWGPFFPDLIVSISVLFFLFYVFKNKEFYFFDNKPLIIFFIFCIYCISLSVFVAEDMMLSFESSLLKCNSTGSLHNLSFDFNRISSISSS